MDAEAGSAVRSPPLLGQHTAEVITQWLAWSASEAAKLQEKHEKLRSAA
jgi:crotonobetainyl-CoA:carnitine CoA-transferase CaiB-like acyl-CoA transferase